MPKLHDYRADFRKGRIGPGMRARQDTKAYISSVREARNMMVLSDAGIMRRWGTLIVDTLASQSRIEPWDYAAGNTTRFLLVFQNAKLTILDLTLTERASFTGMPWDADTMRFLSLTYSRNKLVISDATMQTQILTLDTGAGTFSIAGFAFGISDDGTRMRAPFFSFADDDLRIRLNIFSSAGTSTGYGVRLINVAGFDGLEFNLKYGTGLAYAESAFFTADHIGSRIRLLDGELEITAVTDAQNAEVKVWRSVAKRLDVNPFFLRKASSIVEVAAENHGLSVGDKVFFYGLSDGAALNLMTHAVGHATSGTSAPGAADGAAAYRVQKIVDANHFEIEAVHGASAHDAAYTQTGANWKTPVWSYVASASTGTTSGIDQLSGGSDVHMVPLDGILGVKEPAFSEARGWPQACGFHETRLWLGGTDLLADAAWASGFSDLTNFDPGEGGPADAIQIYGIGEQARIRHFVSGFDLAILTDTQEIYIPGATDRAVTQETVRAVAPTDHGASYTIPQRFDGGVFFVDALGTAIREFNTESRDQEYTAPDMTVIVPDWVKSPVDTTLYAGSLYEKTPYMLFVNEGDGSILVMHSSRQDDAFGFQRWDIDGATVQSVAGIGHRLFAAVERDGEYFLLEFDTMRTDFTTTDFALRLEAAIATTSWSAPEHANRTAQIHIGGLVYSDVVVGPTGDFVTPEAVTEIVIGQSMPWDTALNAPIAASGEGSKIGTMQRLVSAKIYWREAETGEVSGQPVLSPLDVPLFGAPVPVDEWREYWIGEWGREPLLVVEGDKPGHVGMRAVVMDVYF